MCKHISGRDTIFFKGEPLGLPFLCLNEKRLVSVLVLGLGLGLGLG